MNRPVVVVEGLTKVFEMGDKSARNIFQAGNDSYVTAVNDISFQLKEGEMCGLIGKNGAGKTTLLELLCGIVKPTAGTITFNGVVASVIEIGTGMHQDLSGIENIFLAGSLLGFSKKEIEAKLPEIAAFSELGDFLKRPVKYYSSGMFVRLAFSAITHLEADILLIDEVIGVGDIAFSEKTLKKIMEICRKGKTALIASHSLSFVTSSCNTAIYMNQGKLIAKGPVSDIIEQYVEQILHDTVKPTDLNPELKQAEPVSYSAQEIKHSKEFINRNGWGENGIKLISARITGTDDVKEEFTMNDPIAVELEIELDLKEKAIMSMHFNYQFNQPGICISPLYSRQDLVPLTGKGKYKLTTKVDSGIMNSGLYTISLLFANLEHELLCQYKNIIVFKIKLPKEIEESNYYEGGFNGPVFLKNDWSILKV